MTSKKICIFILLMVILCGCTREEKKNMAENKEFRIEDYTEYIENGEYKYRGSIKKKTIHNEIDAKEMAESIWLETYGDEVLKQKPYVILRDDKEKVWLVHGTMEEKHMGGVANIIINDEGEVLALWHEK